MAWYGMHVRLYIYIYIIYIYYIYILYILYILYIYIYCTYKGLRPLPRHQTLALFCDYSKLMPTSAKCQSFALCCIHLKTEKEITKASHAFSYHVIHEDLFPN